MRTEQQLRAAYDDLLSGGANPATLGAVGRLDAALAPLRATEAPPELSARIDRAASLRGAPLPGRAAPWRRWWGARQQRRRSTLAACLLALLCLTGVAYVGLPAMERALRMNAGSQELMDRNLGVAVNQSRTVDGFTVTVERAYADANQVMIAYSVRGPEGRAFLDLSPGGGKDLSLQPTLTDSRGRKLWGPDSWGEGAESGVAASVQTYRVEAIAPGQEELRLRLRVPAVVAEEKVGDVNLDTDRSLPYEDSCTERSTPVRCFNVPGPLTWEFVVPVEESRIAVLGQTARAGGKSVTLGRVVVSPTVTRVYLRGVDLGARPQLSVDGWSAGTASMSGDLGGTVVASMSGEGRTVFDFPGSLMDKRGEWRLDVPAGGRTATFRFRVP
jgi:hypothetical protein